MTASTNIINTLGIDGSHIFFDGALVCNPQNNEEIYARQISPDIIKKAADVALQNGILLDLFSSTRYFVIAENWRSDIRRDFFGITVSVEDFTTIWRKERIIKGGIVVSSPEEEIKAREYISQFEDCLSFSWTTTPAYPGCHFINIIDIGVSKGKALEALTSRLEISMDDVLAIGDGTNDVSLLSTAGFSIAMQNAPPELKSVADYVTADVEQNGVSQAIRKFLL
jgi:Cof subfamily protein (haloacid dehalogenase superfamily)